MIIIFASPFFSFSGFFFPSCFTGYGAPYNYPADHVGSEDFGLENARRILDKYRPDMACFNDDIQGTGCITLAAIMSGLHVSKVKLGDMRTVIYGSGTAGIGIADQVRDAIAIEAEKSKEDAIKQIWQVQ